MFQEVVDFLDGKKTYLVGTVTALTAVLTYLKGGESISTALSNTPGLMLYAGSFMVTVRAAVAKVEAKVDTALSKKA